MKNNRLGILQKYIEEQGLDQKNNNAILADFTGKIISLAGFSYNLGLIKPLQGSNLADFHPVFEGIFPFSEKLLLIPNIETQPDVFWDIHILQGNRLCWVIFEEKTEIVSQLRPGLQKRNLHNLFQEGIKNNDNLASKALGFLDILVLKQGAQGEWDQIGEVPYWLTDFFSKKPAGIIREDITTAFPFLDSFFDDENFEGDSDFYSGIWSENKSNIEYHFRAQTKNIPGSKFLIIKKLHPEYEVNKELIQHARNQVLAYEELKKSASLAVELNKIKEQFISIISHDLRSPFISIISALDFLFEDPAFTEPIEEEHREFLDYIHEDSKRVLDYLEKLLDWTRLDTGKLQPEIQKVDFQKLAKLSYAQFEQRLREKDITLELDIENDFNFMADPTLFSQVINNLIGNAIKFTPRKGRIIIKALKIKTGDETGKEIRIKDSGIGIPPDKLSSLFKEYEKHYTYGTEGEKGSGFGLSITKKILDVHNFSISCISELEKGSEFIIVL
ncbi:MAG: HAMP domain-containing sensor histidine kinase [Bacteroidota bacterium]|nr:HAMP domain-containing sensor histidine kinase [Bacteroidota bacterium]